MLSDTELSPSSSSSAFKPLHFLLLCACSSDRALQVTHTSLNPPCLTTAAATAAHNTLVYIRVNPVTGSPAPDSNIIVHKLCLDTSGIGEGGALRCNDLIPSTPAKRKHAATATASSASSMTAASTGLSGSSSAQGAGNGDSMDVEVQGTEPQTEPDTEPSWDAAVAEATAAKRPRGEAAAAVVDPDATVGTEPIKTEPVKSETVKDETAEEQL
jgi:hypothetical protein